MFTIRLSFFTLLFTFFTILLLILNARFRWTRLNVIVWILIGVICLLSPIDVAFRPSQQPRISVLPQILCRDSFQNVRLLLEAGKKENIDFIVANSGCSGPSYPHTAIVVFYPSQHTTHFGFRQTPEAAEKRVQETLKIMKEWRQQQQEREQTEVAAPP